MNQSSSQLSDMDVSNTSSDLGPQGSMKSKQDTDELTDTLNAFLTSSLNVELVYTILKGIRRIVKTPDLVSAKTNNDCSSVNMTLKNIKIRSFKMWEDALQQQFLGDPNMPTRAKVDSVIQKEF